MKKEIVFLGIIALLVVGVAIIGADYYRNSNAPPKHPEKHIRFKNRQRDISSV